MTFRTRLVYIRVPGEWVGGFELRLDELSDGAMWILELRLEVWGRWVRGRKVGGSDMACG
jgi:hypothetical protein